MSKTFVMNRDSLTGDFLELISPQESAKKNLKEEMYTSLFYDNFLNLESQLSTGKHKLLICYFLPALAQYISEHNEDYTKAVISEVLKNYKNDEQLVLFSREIQQKTTILCRALEIQLHGFFQYKKQKGIDKSIEKYSSFYFHIENSFFNLPVCTMIKALEILDLIQEK